MFKSFRISIMKDFIVTCIFKQYSCLSVCYKIKIMPRWIKITLRIFLIIIGIVFTIYFTIAAYVNFNKDKLGQSLTTQLNKNLNGSLTIGGIDAAFLRGFPNISLTLTNVVVKDKQWASHKHTLLTAKRFDVALNTLALITGTVEIKKIGITKARIYLYTDTNGYSNTSIFKKKTKEQPTEEDGSTPQLRRFALQDVDFILDNKKGNKLFHVQINEFTGRIDYPGDGWEAQVKLKTFVKSLAFNTKRGSFIENKVLEGPFSLKYNEKTEVILLSKNKLRIGDEDFNLKAQFNTALDPMTFAIHLEAEKLRWKGGYSLLTPNISRRLKMFDFEKPIQVKCSIVGNMGPGADPHIVVTALVRDNILQTPKGKVLNCNFDGLYTNNRFKGRGYNDANSIVRLVHFKGVYEKIPFYIDTAAINNFERPVATGVFNADFEVDKLNEVIGLDLLKFNSGRAKMKLAYKADLVDLELTKPYVQGDVVIKDAGFTYVPRNLVFKNTSLTLKFTEKDLLINNLRLQSGKSVVRMEGTVRNFLNLYYTDPQKIVLNWDIRSPQLYLGEFFSFLSSRKNVVKKKKKNNTSNFSDDLEFAFDKSRVNMNLAVDKIYYNQFVATNARANLFLSQEGISLRNVHINHAGGALDLNGSLKQEGESNLFKIKANIKNVNIKQFFHAFNNFGLTSLTSDNLKGYLFSKTEVSGRLSKNGALLKHSINGHVIFDLKEGELIKFEPITGVGKFAFPLRDLNNIKFRNLNGKFDISGQKITINPMQISSSVLNMNVAGIYSLSSGTNIALDIPLRNPKKDSEIEDKTALREKRMKGIVLRILAVDGDDGKIKFKWNKER